MHATCQKLSPAIHVSYLSHPLHWLLFPFPWQNASQSQRKGRRTHLAQGLRGRSPSWLIWQQQHTAGTLHVWEGQEAVAEDASLPLSPFIQSWMFGMLPPTFKVGLWSSVKPFCKQHHRHAYRRVSPVLPNLVKLTEVDHHMYPLNCPVKSVLWFGIL